MTPVPVRCKLFGADVEHARLFYAQWLRTLFAVVHRAGFGAHSIEQLGFFSRRPLLPSAPIISNSAADDKESVAYVG